jgi:hypothetical protein
VNVGLGVVSGILCSSASRRAGGRVSRCGRCGQSCDAQGARPDAQGARDAIDCR